MNIYFKGAYFHGDGVQAYGFSIEKRFLRVWFKGAVFEAPLRQKNDGRQNRTPKTDPL